MDTNLQKVYENFDQKSIIIQNIFAQGNRTTPSYVAFTDSERLIGDAAKNQVAMNPTNTIFGKHYKYRDIKGTVKEK